VPFCAWLERERWSVEREVSFVAVLARRDGVTLYAEAKGRTTSLGLDVDSRYGQLLRRMTDSDPMPATPLWFRALPRPPPSGSRSAFGSCSSGDG